MLLPFFNAYAGLAGKKVGFQQLVVVVAGAIDKALLGGNLQGRRSQTTLKINDVIDFWRVEDFKKTDASSSVQK